MVQHSTSKLVSSLRCNPSHETDDHPFHQKQHSRKAELIVKFVIEGFDSIGVNPDSIALMLTLH